MTEIAIVRAAHLHLFIAEFRAMGLSVERALDRSRLPPGIEETPDAYISMPLAFDWIAQCGRDIEPMELGFRASQRGTLASLGAPLRHAILEAPTGLRRLQALLRFADGDDNVLETGMVSAGDRVRIICDVTGFQRDPLVCFAEWVNIHAMITLVRSVAGPAWCPHEMTFVSFHSPPSAAQNAFPDTRIMTGRPHTSILVERSILAQSCGRDGDGSALEAAPHPSTFESGTAPPGWTFYTALKSAVRPYVVGRCPRIEELAEVLNISKRTLQRRLQSTGQTYSTAVEEARFDLARELLSEPSAKIIDVAMSVGYENSQHFSRAFRRIAGIAPAAYRRNLYARSEGALPGS